MCRAEQFLQKSQKNSLKIVMFSSCFLIFIFKKNFRIFLLLLLLLLIYFFLLLT